MAQLKDLLVTGPARFLTKINADVKGNADTATRATNDANGNNIASTYDTIASVDNKVANVQTATNNAQTTANSALSIANAAMPKAGGKFTGPISFQSSSLPGKTLQYITGIDAFADGGELGWQSKSDFLNGYATTTALENEIAARANADTLKTDTSVLPNNSGEIKTKFRISQKGYTNGATWYYKICDFPINNSGNYTSAIISGRIGGWTSDNMSYINALLWNRGTPGIALIDIAGSASAMSSIWNIADLVLYVNDSSATAANTATLYVKCVGYFVFDLDLELFQSSASITYDGTYITTTPSGTLAGQSSTTTKRLEVVNSKLYVGGKELPFSDNVRSTYATKTELNTEITNRTAADDAIIADKISKSNTEVQTIAGGLVLGATATTGLSGTGLGRIMMTGQTNPLIGVQAKASDGTLKTPYYIQSLATDDKLYIGPTSSKALSFDTDGNMSSSANIAIGGTISEGGTLLSVKYAANSNATTSVAGLMSSTDKTKLNNTNIAYGTCTTAAATAAKVVTISGNTNWALAAGSVISVYFSNTNTASSPTLNVNSTGAKNIYYGASQITTSNLGYAGTASRMMNFIYDGTQYRFIGWGYDANTNTQLRVYRQDASGYDGDYPLIASRTKAASIGTVGTESSYTAVYGLISDTDTNIPTINPYSGLLKAKNITATGTITAASFSGSGSSLTGLNAGNISSGTLPIARGGTSATTAESALANLYGLSKKGDTFFINHRDNTAGYYLIGSDDAGTWRNRRTLFFVQSRHSGNGLVSIDYGVNSGTISDSTAYCDISYFGSKLDYGTSEFEDNTFLCYYNDTDKKFYFFWHYKDYNTTTLTTFTNPYGGFVPSQDTSVFFTSQDDIATTYGTLKAKVKTPWQKGDLVTGAVWNDYAEYRNQKEEIEPGYCVASTDNGKVYKTTEMFQASDGIVSDTFGFAIGETDDCKTPLAVAGRVLAYCAGNREDYHSGDTVCAGPGGLVYKMTREEIREYPDRIIGIVSEIPEYEIWGTGNVKVNNRIWIKI